MADRQHSILVDLSPATGGDAGIPNEARLLLYSLWRTSGMAPTGMLFACDNSVLNHRFLAAADPGKRLENHAMYLHSLSRREAFSNKFQLLKFWQIIGHALRCTLGWKAQMQLIDNYAHGESVWRLVLSQTLGEAGLELAQDCPIALANLSRWLLRVKAYFHLPTLFLDTSGFDFMLMHEPLPLRIRPQTCKLIRYHDLITSLRPETVGSREQIKAHAQGIRRCLRDSVFVCNSEPTRHDLVRYFPESYDRAVTIPNLIGEGMYPDRAEGMLPAICRSRQTENLQGNWRRWLGKTFPPYLLLVSTLEPRKNHLQLIRAYEKLISRHRTRLRLLFVGGPGWRHDEIHQAMKPLIESGKLLYLQALPVQELRLLYSHAEAVVFPSFYEGFGYCPLEAMQCDTPALASDIPTHRWVYGDAAMYFNPFDVDSLCNAIESLLFENNRRLRNQMIERGRERFQRFRADAVGLQWRTLCEEIYRQGGGAQVQRLRLANLKLELDSLPSASIRLASAA